MITEDPALFASLLPPRARLAGLDLGTKTIGLASASLEVGIATAVRTIRRTRFQADAAALLDFVRHESIAGLVLGLPLNMDGSSGPRVQATRAFARNLGRLAPPPMLLFDERLSSATAEDALRDVAVSAARRRASIDAEAARVILQDALSRMPRMMVVDPLDDPR